jgi:hypothetical protein
MRATVMYGAGDVRIENVPDARLIEPTDALVVVSRRYPSIIPRIVTPVARSATLKLVLRS